jgi:carbon monoxide dehydrogenase subunit G
VELTNSFTLPTPLDDAWALLNDLERVVPCMPGAALTGVQDDSYLGQVKVKVGPITAQFKGTARFTEQDADAHRVVIKADGKETRGQGAASAVVTATLTARGDSTDVDVVTELTISGKIAQFGRGVIADVSGKLIDQFVANVEAQILAGPPEPVDAPEPFAPELAGAPEEPASSAADLTAADATIPEPVRDESINSESINGGSVNAGPGRESAELPRSETLAGDDGPPLAEKAVTHNPAFDKPIPRPAPIRTSAFVPGADPEPIDLLGIAGFPVAKRLLPVGIGVAFLLLLAALRRRHRRK